LYLLLFFLERFETTELYLRYNKTNTWWAIRKNHKRAWHYFFKHMASI